MLALSAFSALASPVADLARPAISEGAARLASEPNIWITHDFLSQATVTHMLSKIPRDEAKYSPCIGQVDEFDSKRCTFLPVEGDAILEAALAKVEHAWDVDVARLMKGGLPIIRYLPGAPPVGKHGDEDRYGRVPNATLVMYLTQSDRTNEGATGQTIFPEAEVTVTPRQGSVLSFQNVDASGAPHPKGKHLVSAVPKEAAGDRMVVQIPIKHKAGLRPYAYPEHVSGAKKPGQHEKMHGSAEQKAAYSAAVAAGMSIAVAYMAAKAGKYEDGDKDALEEEAKATGKFSDADFTTPAN